MSSTDRLVGGRWRDAALHLLGSLLDIGRTRLALVTVELEEERLRLVRLFIGAVVALYLLFIGLLLAVACFVLMVEPGSRVIALGACSLFFLSCAALATWRWRRLAARRSPMLAATLAELHADRLAVAETGSDR